MGSPIVVSFVNLKGGVGKTALSVNFAAHCGRKGKRTLLIDLDPQTNATFSCVTPKDWQKHSESSGTVANLLGLRKHKSAEDVKLLPTKVTIKKIFDSVDLIPSHLDLFTIDLDLGGASARETILKRALREFIQSYDIVICDCPPNLTIPTQNSLAMSTHYVVPVSPDFLSALGVSLLINRVKKLGDDLENPINLAGIVLSRIGRPSDFREQTMQTIRDNKTFGKFVLKSEIRERSAVAESAGKRISVFGTSDADAKREFTQFGDELLQKLGLT